MTRTRPASRCSSITPGAYGWTFSISSSAAASAAARTASTGQPAVARAARRAVGAVIAVSPSIWYVAATRSAPGSERWWIPAAPRWDGERRARRPGDQRPVEVEDGGRLRTSTVHALMLLVVRAGREPSASVDDRRTGRRNCGQTTVSVTSMLPRVALEYGQTSWALATVGLGGRPVERRGVHVELHLEPEPAVVERADADGRRDLGAGDVEPVAPGDDLQRRVEARRVAGGEQLLGVGRPAGPAHRLRDAHVGVEDAVVAGDVAVAAVPGGGGGRGVEDLHGPESSRSAQSLRTVAP